MRAILLWGNLLLLLTGCVLTESLPQKPATPPVMVDSFFYGRAYLDANGNGEVDPDDPPLAGAMLSATDAAGRSGGGRSGSDGVAQAWWPDESTFPITLSMSPPEGYAPVGPEEVVLQEAECCGADFLFASLPLDEDAFWDEFPLPDDAEIVPVTEGFDLGFVVEMVEPELFDFYARWLQNRGWQQQAPTEAMVTLPHQRWRKAGYELLIEIEGVDDQNHLIVWVLLREQP